LRLGGVRQGRQRHRVNDPVALEVGALQAADAVGRLGRSTQLLARVGVPEAHRPDAAPGGQELAVRAEGDGADRLARGEIPEASRRITAYAGQDLAVGAEGDGL